MKKIQEQNEAFSTRALRVLALLTVHLIILIYHLKMKMILILVGFACYDRSSSTC